MRDLEEQGSRRVSWGRGEGLPALASVDGLSLGTPKFLLALLTAGLKRAVDPKKLLVLRLLLDWSEQIFGTSRRAGNQSPLGVLFF